MSLSSSKPAIGILCAIIASVAFTLNDVGIKFLSGDYPLHEVVLIRAVIAISITLAILVPMEGGYSILKTKYPWMHLLRGFCVVFANMTFFLGLAAIPLSEATAIFFISPLIITVFSVIFLAEKVGPWRWMAVISGLVGAVIMLRPGTSSFQLAALLPLCAAFGYASLHILTRKMGTTEKASTMAFYIQFTFIIVSSAIGLAFGDGRYAGGADPSIEFALRAWVVPTMQDFLVMAGVGVSSAMGGYFISQAYRVCEAALIAPFEYVALVLAIIWGITIFNEWPDLIAWTGIGLILSAGLIVFWRESVLNKRIASERPMPRQR